uniref:Translation initiation factor 3 N-terminal domain-containing protein n=1 Tax=Auxenochlorella protothecoides TaxID=3075 RepID=A0A1D1ZPC5_AUXPR
MASLLRSRLSLALATAATAASRRGAGSAWKLCPQLELLQGPLATLQQGAGSLSPTALPAPGLPWAARGFASPRRKPQRGNQPELAAAPLKNQEIRAEEVRLVYPEAEGKATEVVALGDALAAARTRQLDLIMVSAVARPPVVRIADFDKVLYEMRKKAKTAAKQQREQQRLADPKEVRIGCRAAPNDLALKVGRARAFLEEGQHLRLSVLFKGARELAEARGVVLSILAHLEGVAVLKDIKHLEKAFKNQWGVQLAPVGQGMGGKAESIVAQLAEAERLYARAQALRAAQGWRPPPLHANAVRGPLAKSEPGPGQGRASGGPPRRPGGAGGPRGPGAQRGPRGQGGPAAQGGPGGQGPARPRPGPGSSRAPPGAQPGARAHPSEPARIGTPGGAAGRVPTGGLPRATGMQGGSRS